MAIKIVFAYTTQTGTCKEYSNIMSEEFNAKCKEYAESNSGFEYEVISANVGEQAEKEKVMKMINEIDHLVVTYPIQVGTFESNMKSFLQAVAQAAPKKLKSNAAFASSGASGHYADKKLTEEELDVWAVSHVTNALNKCVPTIASTFKICKSLPGVVALEKIGWMNRFVMKYIIRVVDHGWVDQELAKKHTATMFETFILGK